MAFNVTLYNFSKKENSTKRPIGGTTYSCILKDTSSVIAPVLKFNFPLSFNVSDFNYARIELYSRYYYISEWTYQDRLWQASLTVDVLATWKNEIGGSNLYVLRSSAESDGHVIDNMYPAKNKIDAQTFTAVNPWAKTLSGGTYIVGIISASTSTFGAIAYYVFTQSQFRNLCAFLMGSVDWMAIPVEEMSGELTKALINPFQYIVSCNWLPFDYPGIADTVLSYGWWNLQMDCARMGADSTKSGEFTIDIPKHPQVARGEYLNGAPYSEYTLSFFPFGIVPLDPQMLIDATSITINYIVDYITGRGRMTVSSNFTTMTNHITTVQAQIGIPIQLSQMAIDYIGMATSGANAAGSIAGSLATGNVAGAITGGISAIGDGIKASIPQLQVSGSGGGIGSLEQRGDSVKLYGKFHLVVDEDLDHRGRPLCANRVISSLPGYVLVADADVSINGTSTENSQITSYLQGGFFYE